MKKSKKPKRKAPPSHYMGEFTDMLSHSSIREILDHDLFQDLMQYRHHDMNTRLTHTLEVALLTYRLAKRKNLDAVSATRGALLHDFYHYHWPQESPGMHGIKHPAISLANAEKHFALNEIERDAILKHMWPITPVPPKFRESRLVNWADKRVTYRDYKRSTGLRLGKIRLFIRNNARRIATFRQKG